MQRIIYLISVAVLALFLPGCNFSNPAVNEVPTIKIVGSTSMLPITETLAWHYQKKNPGVYINVQGGDSTIGIQGVINGIVDIGALSRKLTLEEQEKLNSYIIAMDELSIIIHPQNPIQKLELNQIRGIFSGEIVNWKQLGGADQDISVIVREGGSGTHNVFNDMIMSRESALTVRAAVVPSTGAVKATVARDKNAIGYISSNYISEEVKTVIIKNGEKESRSLVRPLIYITQKRSNPRVEAFLEFATGTEAQSILVNLEKKAL